MANLVRSQIVHRLQWYTKHPSSDPFQFYGVEVGLSEEGGFCLETLFSFNSNE